MIDTGEVVGVDDKYLKVRVSRDDSCGSCHACHPTSNGGAVIKVLNPGNIKKGDSVQIEVPEGKMVQSAFLLYGLPLLGLFTGFSIGSIIKLPINQELTTFFTGIIGMVLSIIFLKYLYKKKVDRLLPGKVIKVNTDSELTVRDPVCGMDVSIKNPAATVIYKNKTYLFCSVNCRRIFQENPEKYIK